MDQKDLIFLPNVSVKELLLDTDWLNDFTPTQIDSLAAYFTPYSVKTGITILKEGELYDFFALIAEGSVNVCKQDFSGKSKYLLHILAGKAFGEMSFFDNVPCSASVIAKENSIILVMHRENFTALVEEFPHTALTMTVKIIRTISQRLRQTSGKLIDLI